MKKNCSYLSCCLLKINPGSKAVRVCVLRLFLICFVKGPFRNTVPTLCIHFWITSPFVLLPRGLLRVTQMSSDVNVSISLSFVIHIYLQIFYLTGQKFKIFIQLELSFVFKARISLRKQISSCSQQNWCFQFGVVLCVQKVEKQLNHS